MMVEFLACPSCARHLRSDEQRCPFCDAAVDFSRTPRRRRPSPRLSRSAQLAFTVTLGAHLARCVSSSDTEPRAPTAGTAHGASDSGSEGSIASDGAPNDVGAGAPDAAPDTARRYALVPVYGGSTLQIGQQIHFSPHSARLRDESQPVLDAVAEILKVHPVKLEVRGHTAPDEKRDGKWLAKQRAQMVVDALVKAGVPRQLLTVTAVLATGESKTPPEYQRSVEFIVLEQPDGWQ